MKVMASTIWVRRRMGRISSWLLDLRSLASSCRLSAGLRGRQLANNLLLLLQFLRFFLLFGTIRAVCRRASVLFEFVMQSLQADAQNLGSAGLVVVGGLESLQNQQPLGFAYGCAHAHANRVRIIG